ncbi:gamma-glutamyltransferase family protein [Skermanella pratensis]|uniref:gamma-glutamyltransferase family protein n=1 Tax=Skermanella pratensis TaxID=2233999 RepID=UPI001300DB6B|nr:gamma-glutamyltransferase family protein [Skermanella pratensis]
MFTTRPEILGTFGAVTSTHWLASAAGMAVLEKGGNAFDAAVATGFVLQIVEPHLNGPAGEAPILIYNASEDRVRVICGQGTAPGAATIQAYRDQGLSLIPGTGLLAAVVPGAFDAWLTMLRDHGTMELADVLEPAIYYAETGHPMLARVSQSIDTVSDMFREDWPTSAATWLPNGEVPKPGALFRNERLAATYKRLVREAQGPTRESRIQAARDQFYQGFVAEAIDRFCRTNEVMDVSGRRHRGLLSGQDMAGWKATYEDPLTYEYRNYTVCKTGPWGQGPVFLQQLALLKGFDLDSMDPNGPDFVHTVIECMKLAFADREAYYGDPDFVEVPVETLLSDAYNDERRKLVGDTASMELRPGRVPGFEGQADRAVPGVAGHAGSDSGAGAGEPTMAHLSEQRGERRGDTCHIDVIDRWGNMVSATPSGGWLQSSPIIPELGFALTSRAQMFWLEEGLPSSLAPGKRPRTTLTPSMALRDGKPYMAFGTPGGDQQDQWQPIFFLRHVHYGLNLQETIDQPLFHTDHFPGSFYPRASRPGSLSVESNLPASTIEELLRRGHNVEVMPEWSIGRLCAASREQGIIKAAATPRLMQAYAIGR